MLIGATCLDLVYISFVSNPSDEARLETAEYRQRIAELLYRGIADVKRAEWNEGGEKDG